MVAGFRLSVAGAETSVGAGVFFFGVDSCRLWNGQVEKELCVVSFSSKKSPT